MDSDKNIPQWLGNLFPAGIPVWRALHLGVARKYLNDNCPSLLRTIKQTARTVYHVSRAVQSCLLFLISPFVITFILLRGFLFGKKSAEMKGNRILMVANSDIDHDPRINKEANSLAKAGFLVDILCYYKLPDGKFKIIEKAPGLRYLLARGRDQYTNHAFGYRKTLWNQSKKLTDQYHAVHCHDLVVLLTGWCIARRFGIPLIYDAHEMCSENVDWNGKEYVQMSSLKRWYFSKWEKFLVDQCAVFISVSNSICDEYQKRYRLSQRPLLLANTPELSLLKKQTGIDRSIREELGLDDSCFITLYLGGLGPARNIERVIQAHSYLPKNHVFVIRGVGYDFYGSQYCGMADEVGLRNRIFCLPAVAMDELVAASRGADCGIVMLRNLSKNFYWFYPNKFFEYMLYSLPVAVSDFPDVGEHIRRERCGVTFDPDNPQSIADALLSLSSNRQEAKAMGKRGFDSVCEKYNWDRSVLGLIEAYRCLQASSTRED